MKLPAPAATAACSGQPKWNACLSCLFLSAACASAPAQQPTPIYVDQVPPLFIQQAGQARGLLSDLLHEMGQRTHQAYVITPLPLARLRVKLLHEPQALGTLWRAPELEPHYQWWLKILDASFVMVARPESTFDIGSAQAALDLRVGVLLGSPAELVARREGFRHIESSASLEGIARKLLIGRIDIWIASPRVLKAVFQGMSQPLPSLRVSGEIARLGLYLGSAKGVDETRIAPWRAAFDAMKTDQTYAAILAKYPESRSPGP